MLDPNKEMWRQARQGSITAIIQILNDKFTDQGIRTRAVLDEGILQLLCEGSTSQQLEQTTLVTKIKELLEAIAPKNFRKVEIHSRITSEHQILWLEEIRRDPTQLLWTQAIILKKPHLWKQIQQFRHQTPDPYRKQQELLKIANKASSSRKRPPNYDILKASMVGVLSIFGSWLIYEQLNPNSKQQAQQTIFTVSNRSESKIVSRPKIEKKSSDSFEKAVRLAIQASAEGIKAQQQQEWLDLAAKWQEASDLMASVPPDHPRYQEAQEKIKEYSHNKEIVIKKAAKSQETNPN